MAIPALKQYKKKHPDTYLCVATLKNRCNATVEILSPFVDEVAPILTEPWEFVENGTGDLAYGRRVAGIEAEKYIKENGFEYGIEVTMSPLLHLHKVVRVALELGMFPLDSVRPEIKVTDEMLEFGGRFVLGRYYDYLGEWEKPPHVFFHGKAGNKRKTLSHSTANIIIDKCISEGFEVIECDSWFSSKTIKYDPLSINQTIGILSVVDKVVCIDSIVMHLAYALDKKMDVYFSITPKEQVFGRGFRSNKIKVGQLL